MATTSSAERRQRRRAARTRQELGLLAGLTDELGRCLTETPQTGDGGSGGHTARSKPPLRLDVLHLTDPRLKPDWDQHDPREESPGDRFGVLAVLASWTRIVWEESDLLELADPPTVNTETQVLLEWFPWIERQDWVERFFDAVIGLANQIRVALGEVRLNLRCPQCGDHAGVEGTWLRCDSGHETSVRNLAQQQQRRPPMTLQAIAAEFNLNPATIRKWNERGKLQPLNPGKRPLIFKPWDVFRVMNPDLVAAAERR